MANQRRDHVPQPQARGIEAGLVQGGGGNWNTGFAELARGAAGGFAQISDKLGRRADKAAAKEGDLAGRMAGLDPEFRPQADATIYGDAYDQAGIETYRSQLSTRLSQAMEETYEKHKGSPAGLQKALAGLKAGFDEHIFDAIRPEFELGFEKQSVALVRAATREHRENVRAAQASALELDVETRRKRIEQSAYRLGLDTEADAILGAEIGDLTKRLAVVGPDGLPLVKPDKAGDVVRAAAQSVVKARIKGAFARLPSGDAQERFLADFTEGFMKGGDKLFDELDVGDFEALQAGMASDIRSARAASDTASRALKDEVKAVSRMAGDGFSLPDADLDALKQRVIATGSVDLADEYNQAVGTLTFTRAASQAPPGELEAFVASERQRLTKDGAGPAEFDRLEQGEKLLGKMREGLGKDPLGWADRTGFLAVPALDLSAQNAGASLKARAAAAETIAGHFGVVTKFFRPEEAAVLARLADAGGEQMMATAQLVVGSLAPRQAVHALGEISKESPVLAQIGGLLTQGGDARAAADAASGIALRQTEGFKSRRPEKQAARQVVASVFGLALAAFPSTEDAILEMADAIYETRAARKGLPEFDPDLYGQALRSAAGEVEEGGEVYGGLTTLGGGYFSSGRKVLVPPSIKKDNLDDVIDAITDADLGEVKPRSTDQGFLGADAIKRSTLVSIGNGRYYAALGDPDGEDPQWLLGDDFQPYVLDLDALAPALRKRLPQYFRGG